MKQGLFFMFLFVLFFSSCKNEVDITAGWKEIPVVYALLNQADSAQYIKINKVFLGPGNALQYAQVYDSINYTNPLEVKMQRMLNGFPVGTAIVFQLDNSIVKEPGIFASAPNQMLYKTKEALFEDHEYLLTVKNTQTGKIATSKTKLIKGLSVTKPSSSTVSFTNPTLPFKAEWKSSTNGRLYQMIIRFHYIEYSFSDTVQKHIDWPFAEQRSNGLSGGENMQISFLGEDFYRYLKIKIKDDPNVTKRTPGTLDFIFTVGGDELSTFIEVNRPSSGILQEKPPYTNIENGIGVFSTRYSKILPSKTLNIPSADSLYAGIHTVHLRFCNPSPASPYHCN